MVWISLVCLLALSSSAFSRSAYGDDYGSQSVPVMKTLFSTMGEQTIQRPSLPVLPTITQGYGQQQGQGNAWTSPLIRHMTPPVQLDQHIVTTSALDPSMSLVPKYGNSYGSTSRMLQRDEVPPQVPVMTPADILCRGQLPETVIPSQDHRKFVVCLDDSKGVEQECPKGLFYHEKSRQCERKLGALEDPCIAHPCLNGGQCISTTSSYQCQCATGFDGKTCELDARVCQTQQPCGQSPDTRCQSFRLGAALQYICIFQDGLAYGLNSQQVQPSPCQNVDGPHALAVTNNGFIMCDGERMFIESCPGGTIWDNSNKACAWPDMQIPTPQSDQERGYGQSSYGSQRTLVQPTYSSQMVPSQLERPKQILFNDQASAQSYGTNTIMRDVTPLVRRPSYGDQIPISYRKHEHQRLLPSYGDQMHVPQPRPEQQRSILSYGSQIPVPQPRPEQQRSILSYGSQIPVPQPRPEQQRSIQSYGGQIPVPQPRPEQQKLISSDGGQQHDADVVSAIQPSGY